MKKCKDCNKSIDRGVRCTNCSKLNYRKNKREIKMYDCAYKGLDGCTNNSDKGFRNPQALGWHIKIKHADRSRVDLIQKEEKIEDKLKESEIMAKKEENKKDLDEEEDEEEKDPFWDD